MLDFSGVGSGGGGQESCVDGYGHNHCALASSFNAQKG